MKAREWNWSYWLIVGILFGIWLWLGRISYTLDDIRDTLTEQKEASKSNA